MAKKQDSTTHRYQYAFDFTPSEVEAVYRKHGLHFDPNGDHRAVIHAALLTLVDQWLKEAQGQGRIDGGGKG